jgi:ATP-dependent exoDNAse (exonuclease V) alpha subunit
MKAEWRSRAAAYGINPERIGMEAQRREGQQLAASPAALNAALQFSRSHNTEREAVIDRRALEAAALQYSMGRADLDQVHGQIAIEEHDHRLIRASKPDWQHPQGAFTTDEMLALERENLELVRAGKDAATPVADNQQVNQWGQGRGLLPDQIRAAELTLTATDWVTAIEGLAGATKTTTVGAIRELAEAHGFSVRGFGPTSGSVKVLREAGIEARTVASLLANPLPMSTPKELWFIDESSLLATRPVNAMLKAARAHGVTRVVFVGDQRQHHAIEAGAPARQLLQAALPVAQLAKIRRQRDPQLRRAVEFAAHGKVSEALDLLASRGWITEIPDASERYELIATDYLRAHEAGQRTLVVSPGNDERRDLNHAIRTLLVARGHVAMQGQEHGILVRRDLTRPQLKHAHNYQPGDILHFPRGSKRIRLAKDGYARIDSMDTKANLLMLKLPDDTRINFNPGRWRGLEVYRPEHRTLAVGDRLQFRAPDRALKVANGEFVTILALHRKQATLRLDNERELTAKLTQLQRVDHGYAATSHAAQGATVDRVIVNVDSMRSAQLVNRKQFYVSISRARYDAQLYTDDAEAMRRALARNPQKAIALDLVKTRATQELRKAEPTGALNLPPDPPELQHLPSISIRR